MERSDYSEGDRAAGHEQIDAFRDICNAMLAEWDLADRLLPLAEARAAFQAEVEADEACWKRRGKRGRRRKPAAAVVRLVPRPSGDPSEDEPGAP